MPVKVLHLFGAMARGGAEIRTLELVESLDPTRVQSDFAVLSCVPGPLESRAIDAGAAVHHCQLGAGFLRRFVRLLGDGGYDVVHSHLHYFSGPLLMLAAYAKVPTRIAHFRTSADDHMTNTLRRRVQRSVFRKLIDLYATDILGVSAGVLDLAWHAEWASSDARCQVVYNGIAASRLEGTQTLRSGGRRLINVASIQPRKNQLRLLDIFEICVKSQPDLSLAFVGRASESYAETLRNEIRLRNLEDRVQVVGEVGEPIELIRSSDLLVLPSLWEGLPGVALEASAIGVPALLSDLPGARELAGFFPSVRCLSLDEGNEVWAAAVSEALASSASFRETAAARYLETPFSLNTSREQYYRVWERGGARPSGQRLGGVRSRKACSC